MKNRSERIGVEKLEDWQGKHVDAVIITVDPKKKRLVLSWPK